MRSDCFASLCWCGEENGKKKAKLMGWNKDNLIEQQRKQTVTTIIQIRRTDKAREYTRQFSYRLMPSLLPSSD